MSKALDLESIASDPRHRRAKEREGLLRLADMLEDADREGQQSRAAIDAIASLNAIWSALLEDLVRADNDLPVDLRARIMSVGIYLLKEAAAIRQGRSTEIGTLRDVVATLAEGLA